MADDPHDHSDRVEDTVPGAVSARPRRSDRHRRSGALPPGPRTAARRERRRRQLVQGSVAVFAIVAVGLAVVWAVTTFTDGHDTPAEVATEPSDAPATDRQPTAVVVTFDEAGDGRADLVMVAAHETDTGRSTLVLAPSTLVADVPGHGLLQLAEAFRVGGASLVEVTLANLLGVDFDEAVEVSRQGWAALFGRVDGLELEVEEALSEQAPDGTRTVRFQPGRQALDGPRVAEYLTFRQADESELARFTRVRQVMEGLLDRLGSDPSLLDVLFEDGAPFLEASDTDAVRQLLALLAASRVSDDVDVRSLPVSAVGTAEDASYRLDEDRAQALVGERFAPSVPSAETAAGRRVQVLNGNGVPGIGQQVAEALQPGGFRLVDPGNAASFDVSTTRILVYDDSPAHVAAAQEIQDLLGVGEVEISEVPVSVVDITVIVGLDYPPSS